MKKKIVALLLVGCMGGTMLTGCGNEGVQSSEANGSTSEQSSGESEASGNETEQENSGESEADAAGGAAEVDTSEHVVLTMYCIGDEGGIYAQQHLDELNKVLTEKINAEISPIMVSWGDYKTKLPMVWASGEAYDITYTASWASYFTEGSRGAFMNINELFPAYAPLTYEEMTGYGTLETTKIGGNLYMVPNYIPDYTTYVFQYREDLRKKYDCPEITSYETLNTYLQAIKDNEPGMLPLGNNGSEAMLTQVWLNEMDWSRPIEYGNAGVFSYDLKDPSKVFNLVETPEYEARVKQCREWYEKGYWSQSIMAETTASKDNFKAGKVACLVQNFSGCNGNYQELSSTNPDWEIGYWSSDLASGTTERVGAANNGVAIGAYSKNPERAMMFIELMYQDREVYDILMNGLEGITYEADRDAGVKWIPEGVDSSTVNLKNLGMGFGVEKWYLGSKNDDPYIDELKAEYDKVGVFPGLSGFALNQDPIAAELAALKNVCDEYKVPLEKGVVDPEEGLAELKKQLETAGVEKVMEEINRQIAEYLAQ